MKEKVKILIKNDDNIIVEKSDYSTSQIDFRCVNNLKREELNAGAYILVARNGVGYWANFDIKII